MKELNLNKLIIKTAIITFFGAIASILIMYFVLTLFSPVTLARVTSSLGFDNASIYYYEISYNKSNDINDLYNLLNKTIAVDDEDKIIDNFELLYDDGSSIYYEFMEYMNEFNLAGSTNNLLKLYLANEDSRLKNKYILALMDKGLENDALSFAVNDLINDEVNISPLKYNFIISTYLKYLFINSSTNETFEALESYNYNNNSINLIEYCEEYYNNLRISYNNLVITYQSPNNAQKFEMALMVNKLLEISNTILALEGKVVTVIDYELISQQRSQLYDDLELLIE